MTSPHSALEGASVQRLAEVIAPASATSRREAPAPPPLRRGPRTLAKGAARRIAHRLLGWYVERVVQREVEAAEARLAPRMAAVEELSERTRLELPNIELLKGEVRFASAATVNLELLKGEVRNLLSTVEDLGRAIAPTAGISGAGARLAELRERMNGLERRLRNVETSGPPSIPVSQAEPAAPAADRPSSVLFDYVGFEARFRGDAAEVLATARERYEGLLVGHPPIVDVGCGRGELLSVLAERGREVIGVDTDPGMVADARARGLTVHQTDAVSFLREQPEQSLGAIIAIHVVEHLQLDYLIELLELAVTRLRPGGLFVAETPNPSSLIVLGTHFIMDPTHVWPLHPALLAFLCESAGYRDVDLRFYAPAEQYRLPLIDDPEAPPWVEHVNAAFQRLNDVLFGPQDYAVVATTPPERT